MDPNETYTIQIRYWENLSGDDTLTNGAGDDLFVYNTGDGDDVITDFNAGNSGTLNDGDRPKTISSN